MKNWNECYAEGQLKLFIDISTYCNAGCPECHRTNVKDGGLGKIDWLPWVRWSLEEFKNAYTPELLNQCSDIEVCGTWGDPIMCKDLLPIVEYMVESNPDLHISIDTNGSVRPKSWWRQLGALSEKANRPVEVDFAVEGITQEMHNAYRRKTKLDVILANMKEFTDAGGLATTFCVVHKHNQDFLQEIKDLTTAYGSRRINYVESNRFYDGPTFEFVNENGEVDKLEQATEGYFKPSGVREPTFDWKRRQQYNDWALRVAKKVEQVDEQKDID